MFPTCKHYWIRDTTKRWWKCKYNCGAILTDENLTDVDSVVVNGKVEKRKKEN